MLQNAPPQRLVQILPHVLTNNWNGKLQARAAKSSKSSSSTTLSCETMLAGTGRQMQPHHVPHQEKLKWIKQTSSLDGKA